MYVCPECGSLQPVAGRCSADGTPLAPIGEDVLLGTTIGVYRVARLLGIGGMGRVYKGVHPAIGSRVAIKVLSRECSDRRDLVDRFFAEAKAVNVIRHEGIVNVLDLATLPDGRPYIIMEYLDGAPLASIIEHGVQHQAPLTLGGIARLTADVLDALGAAHAKSIIHRDLKPDNIYVAPSGRPTVLDFGIAKLSDVQGTATRTGSLMGTPHYMAPEQAAGRPVDHRADLYAIGVILFECATGRKPFVAEALFDLLRMHVEAPPPSPRALRPDMPPEFEQVILTALAKPADQRFASAHAMSVALQRATAQLPPDQWRPLVPSSGPVVSAGPSPWAPTPPVSWSDREAQAATAPAMPPTPPLALGTVPTVSAGQVETQRERPRMPRRPASRRRWLGVVAAVVATGGAVAAAAVYLRSGGAPAGSSGAPGPVGSATPDPWNAAAVVLPPAAPVVRRPKATHAAAAPAGSDDEDRDSDEDRDDRDDRDDRAQPGKHGKPSDAMAEALEQLDRTIKALPAAQQHRLAGYRNLAKLPLQERMKKLQALARQGIPELAQELAELASVDFSELPPLPPAAPVAPTAPTPPPLMPAEPAAPPLPPATWITSHAIVPPRGYDPERLDVTAFVPWAIAQARHAIPDAQLIRIDASGVGADGRANLQLATLASDHGSLDLRFISPSRGKRDPSQPLGVARHDFKCEFRVLATPDGVELVPIDFADCAKEHVVPVPRCSASGVWSKAIQRKAPSHNAVGNLGYRSNGSRPVWYFDIGAGFDVAFSEMFGDDC